MNKTWTASISKAASQLFSTKSSDQTHPFDSIVLNNDTIRKEGDKQLYENLINEYEYKLERLEEDCLRAEREAAEARRELYFTKQELMKLQKEVEIWKEQKQIEFKEIIKQYQLKVANQNHETDPANNFILERVKMNVEKLKEQAQQLKTLEAIFMEMQPNINNETTIHARKDSLSGNNKLEGSKESETIEQEEEKEKEEPDSEKIDQVPEEKVKTSNFDTVKTISSEIEEKQIINDLNESERILTDLEKEYEKDKQKVHFEKEKPIDENKEKETYLSEVMDLIKNF